MLGFLFAIVAGLATPYVEAPLAEPIARWIKQHMDLEPTETRMIAFIMMLLLAALVSALLNSGATFFVVFGAGLGYFLIRIVGAIREIIADR
jgi:hypothetical protein